MRLRAPNRITVRRPDVGEHEGNLPLILLGPLRFGGDAVSLHGATCLSARLCLADAEKETSSFGYHAGHSAEEQHYNHRGNHYRADYGNAHLELSTDDAEEGMAVVAAVRGESTVKRGVGRPIKGRATHIAASAIRTTFDQHYRLYG